MRDSSACAEGGLRRVAGPAPWAPGSLCPGRGLARPHVPWPPPFPKDVRVQESTLWPPNSPGLLPSTGTSPLTLHTPRSCQRDYARSDDPTYAAQSPLQPGTSAPSSPFFPFKEAWFSGAGTGGRGLTCCAAVARGGPWLAAGAERLPVRGVLPPPQSQSLERSRPRRLAQGQGHEPGLTSGHGGAACGGSMPRKLLRRTGPRTLGCGDHTPSPLHGETHVDVCFCHVAFCFIEIFCVQIHKTFLLQKLRGKVRLSENETP